VNETFQSSDAEDMDVKDIAELNMVMPKHVSEHLPDDIFEDDTKPSISQRKQIPPSKSERKPSPSSGSVKDDFNKFSLDNLIEYEDEVDLGFTVVKDKAIDVVNVAAEGAVIGMKVDFDDDCIDVETVSEQIPGEYCCLSLLHKLKCVIHKNIYTFAYSQLGACLLLCSYMCL
jgi:hypothetical protein